MTFGRSASTVIRFPGLTRDMALDSLMRRLEALDWRPGPVPEMAIDMRGFHSNTGRGARPPIPSFFCKGTEIISLATSSPLSGVTLVIRHDQGRAVDACNTRATSQVYAADIPYPSLSAHPDVQYTGGSHNSGRDDFFGSQRAVSSINPRALMNHYAPQLLAAGWVAQDSAFTNNLAVRSFVLSSRPAQGPGAAGRMTGDWILVLSITRPDGGVVTDLRFWGNRK
jgi:hypothetical protein